ncbi:MAG: hypothetical protein BWY45_03482 [Euryarchaeota archaeon ADurb.Bin294]|nr:MAG: hypothetical protein BWY45_03482 [Euryarchaeota archaeon ADurb.Bin294]
MPRRSGSVTKGDIIRDTITGIRISRAADITHTLISDIMEKKGRGARNVPMTIIARGVVMDPRSEIDSFRGEGMVVPVPRRHRPRTEAISPGVTIRFRSGFRARSGRRRNTPRVNTKNPNGRLIRVT